MKSSSRRTGDWFWEKVEPNISTIPLFMIALTVTSPSVFMFSKVHLLIFKWDGDSTITAVNVFLLFQKKKKRERES